MIQFDPQNVTVSESEGHVVLQIVKIGVTSVPLTVIFSTIDNQATGNLHTSLLANCFNLKHIVLQDYIPKQETVTFNSSETQKSVMVDIIDDAIYEGTEVFMVSLRAVSSGVLVNGTPTSVYILDEDDCKFLIAFVCIGFSTLLFTVVTLRFVSSQLVIEESEQSVHIMIAKIGHTVVPLVVTVTTEDSTAKGKISVTIVTTLSNRRMLLYSAHADYIPVTMEITFTPEETEISFNVTIVHDEVFENAERFDVVMLLMGHIGRSDVLDRISVIITDSSPSTVP